MKKAYSAPMIMVTIMETTPLMAASAKLNDIMSEGNALNTGDEGTVYAKPQFVLWDDDTE
jgi:hypothetical protein